MQAIEIREGTKVMTVNTASKVVLAYKVSPATHFNAVEGGVASLWEILDCCEVSQDYIVNILTDAGYKQDEDGKWWNQEMADAHGSDVQP